LVSLGGWSARLRVALWWLWPRRRQRRSLQAARAAMDAGAVSSDAKTAAVAGCDTHTHMQAQGPGDHALRPGCVRPRRRRALGCDGRRADGAGGRESRSAGGCAERADVAARWHAARDAALLDQDRRRGTPLLTACDVRTLRQGSWGAGRGWVATAEAPTQAGASQWCAARARWQRGMCRAACTTLVCRAACTTEVCRAACTTVVCRGCDGHRSETDVPTNRVAPPTRRALAAFTQFECGWDGPAACTEVPARKGDRPHAKLLHLQLINVHRYDDVVRCPPYTHAAGLRAQRYVGLCECVRDRAPCVLCRRSAASRSLSAVCGRCRVSEVWS